MLKPHVALKEVTASNSGVPLTPSPLHPFNVEEHSPADAAARLWCLAACARAERKVVGTGDGFGSHDICKRATQVVERRTYLLAVCEPWFINKYLLGHWSGEGAEQ